MNKISTRKALNPAYRKHKPLRKDVNNFIEELSICLNTIKLSEEKDEHEEHFKEPIKTFFKNTFYKDNYINTKDRIDLAVYTGKDTDSDVAVIFEVKRPSNKKEFLTPENLNRKALQELLLYYLRERIDNNNNNIKHLVATNGYEWYLFKGDDFYTYFFKDKNLFKEYKNFTEGKKDSANNELFYGEIAQKYIAKVKNELPFVYLNFYGKNLKEYNDTELNTLYKIFSDVHILGNSFGNDSNLLNKDFYNELLHIIGLEEKKVKGKKLIYRKTESKRDYASILENTIFILEDRDYISKIKSIDENEDKIFNAGLELSLTWINRILFLKLLESQLLSYHNKAKEYAFLNSDFIKGYDDLNDLFFSALAKKEDERHPKYKERFKYIPYLNSSLFERSILEDETFTISSLNDDEIEIYPHTVLKDAKGKRITGKLKTLEYLFKFLDAYDFSADGTEGIEDAHETKTLINASVLGLIFEKINGYKEGSFYTPSYITMYMSRETLRKAVVQKFKEQENEHIETFEDLKSYTHKFFKKEDMQRFNDIVNSLKIVDPAVGSGHFLVSSLNELISIKNDLGILTDTEGLPLQCEIIVENDELYITDRFGNLLDYKPNDTESEKIQKTLFHEKQTIIENCLFGVDINPNSVKICRLRLWIELLKNAYYDENSKLQTLPNIDINIKTGNSLISRFPLNADLSKALKGSKWNLFSYRNAVQTYKNTKDRKVKLELIKLINEIKQNFRTELRSQDPKIKKLNKLKNKFYDLFSGNMLFEPGEEYGGKNLHEEAEKKREAEKKKLEKQINKLSEEIRDIKNNKIYRNAFEWRFEFPEVLDKNGDFLGFDVVIGNPPYVDYREINNKEINILRNFNLNYQSQRPNLYLYFIEQGYNIAKEKGICTLINPNQFLSIDAGYGLRKFLVENTIIRFIDDVSHIKVFEEASTYTVVWSFIKKKDGNYPVRISKCKSLKDIGANHLIVRKNEIISNGKYLIIASINKWLILKIEKNKKKLGEFCRMLWGTSKSGYGKLKITYEDFKKLNKKEKQEFKPILQTRDIKRYYIDWKQEYIPKHLYSDNVLGKFKVDKKIVVARMTLKLQAAIDKKKSYVGKSTVIYELNHNLTQEYLLSILNSKLIDFWYKNYFENTHLSGGYIRFDIPYLKKIPVVIISKQAQQPFIEKVNRILKLKEADINADTSKLEDEIDKMVYKLYGLTEEEIKIIEKSAK